jgi:hypothetical protein
MYEVKELEGELPNKGGKFSTKIKVASVAPIIVMKCAAIKGRLKTKDSYALYYFIRHYRGGGQAVLDKLKPDIKHGSEFLQKLDAGEFKDMTEDPKIMRLLSLLSMVR